MNEINFIDSIRNAGSPEIKRLEIKKLAEADIFNGNIIDLLTESLHDADRGIKDICSSLLSSIPKEYIEITSRSLARLIANKDIELRNLAGDILTRLGSPASNSILPFISDENPQVRLFACNILGNIRDSSSAYSIVKLLDDPDQNVRNTAIEALGNLCYKDALSHLFGIYPESGDLKPTILDAVGKIGGTEAQDFLLERLKHETDDIIRLSCIDALAECGGESSICLELLEELPLFGKAKQPYILKAIFAIARRLGIEVIMPDEYRNAAYTALFDEDEDLRSAGLFALGTSYKQADIPALVSCMMRSSPDTVKHILNNMLVNSDSKICSYFLHSLGESFDSESADLELFGFLPDIRDSIPLRNMKRAVDTVFEICFNPVRAFSFDIISALFDFNPGYVSKKLEELRLGGNQLQKEEAEEILKRIRQKDCD